MDRDSYAQCELVRGNEKQTSWIPSRFAVLGKVLRLRDEGGAWEDGWKILAIHHTKPYAWVKSIGEACRDVGQVLRDHRGAWIRDV